MEKIRRIMRFYLLKFLRLRGTPWKVALGFALGACVNFYPTFGIGVLIAGLLAGLLRFSVTAALLGDLAFKSLFPLFFYFNLLVGNSLLGEKPKRLAFALKRIMAAHHFRILDLKFFGEAFFLGAIVNTIVFGGILTIVIYLLFSRYRPNMASYVFSRKKK